jgi:hypothetical protein
MVPPDEVFPTGRGEVRAKNGINGLEKEKKKAPRLVQRAADPWITKRYNRRGYNPEKRASFFANY